MSDPRFTYAWRKERARVKAESDGVCSWCGRPIDMNLPGTHRWGPTVDHGRALADHGHIIDNVLTVMHNRCNALKEAERRRRKTNPSRDW